MTHDCDHTRGLALRVLARTRSIDLDRLLRGYLRAHALDCPLDKRGDFIAALCVDKSRSGASPAL